MRDVLLASPIFAQSFPQAFLAPGPRKSEFRHLLPLLPSIEALAHFNFEPQSPRLVFFEKYFLLGTPGFEKEFSTSLLFRF